MGGLEGPGLRERGTGNSVQKGEIYKRQIALLKITRSGTLGSDLWGKGPLFLKPTLF